MHLYLVRRAKDVMVWFIGTSYLQSWSAGEHNELEILKTSEPFNNQAYLKEMILK